MVSGNFLLNNTGSTSARIEIRCEFVATSNGAIANSSNVNVKVVATKSLESTATTSGNYTANVIVDGITQDVLETNFELAPGSSTTLFTGTFTVPHNQDGTKNMSITANVGGTVISASGRGTYELEKIEKTADANQMLVTATETTFRVNWTSDSAVETVWYSTDSGASWSNPISVDGSSGSYDILALAPGTEYPVITKIKTKVSQLEVQSEVVNMTTFAYPYAVSTPNFNIGDRVTIGLFNPLGRKVNVVVLGENGEEIKEFETIETSVSGLDGLEEVDGLYESIPTKKFGDYSVHVVFGSNIAKKDGGRYSVNVADCRPTIGECTYRDTNSATTSITLDDTVVITQQSLVQFNVEGLLANKHSEIVRCSFAVNGISYPGEFDNNSATANGIRILSTTDTTAVFEAEDSRGIKTQKEIPIAILEWKQPELRIFEAKRQGGTGNMAEIRVMPYFSPLNGHNQGQIKLRYKKTSEVEYTRPTVDIDPEEAGTILDLDTMYSWDIEVTISDIFAANVYKDWVAAGVPLTFANPVLRSVGINCTPKRPQSLEVNGVPVTLVRSIATAYLNRAVENLVVNANTVVPLTSTSAVSGDGLKFVVENHGIKILNEDAQCIKISGILSFAKVKSNAIRQVRIYKNGISYTNILGWSTGYMYELDSVAPALVIPPIVVNISKDDTIFLCYYTPDAGDIIAGDTNGCRTSLTVEIV